MENGKMKNGMMENWKNGMMENCTPFKRSKTLEG
jgi:hypothetical protein